MIHAPPETNRDLTKCVSTALLVPVSVLCTLCAKKAYLVKKKLTAAHHKKTHNESVFRERKIKSLKLPSAKPPQPCMTISNRATSFTHRRHGNNCDEAGSSEELDFGQGGVWQKSILMGNKCRPSDFSGVIYYDENGKRINELRIRSPRASPLPGYL